MTRRGKNGVVPRARRRLRRGCLPAPHLPGAGPAPAHARDRRQHGQDPERRRVAGARRRADPEAATGSRPATSTRPSCAFELTRSLGVEWREPENGMAEIAGVPRRGAPGVLAAAGAGGRLPRARAAARASTPPRSPRSRRATARSRSTCPACAWSGRRAQPSTASAAESSGGCSTARSCASSTSAPLAEVTARLVGPDGLTGKRSTFSGTEAVMAWAQAHTQGAPAERVLALVDRFLGDRAGRADRSRGGRAAGRLLDGRAAAPRAGGAGARRARPPGSRPGCLGGDGRAGRRRARADARPRAGGDAASGRLEP